MAQTSTKNVQLGDSVRLMDQYTVPAIIPPATTGNLSDLVANRAGRPVE